MVTTNIPYMKNLGLILLGNTIYALAVTMFILPNGLITGGTTGLALVSNHLYGIPVPYTVGVLNLVLFITGAVLLGRTFAVSTVISSFYYPLVLGFFQQLPALQMATADILLAAVYAGVMIGLAIGLVIQAGASTGGMDIPPLVLNRKFGISISAALYGFDFLILLSQMLFASREQILYGLLLVFIYTVVLDKVLLLGQSRTQVQIISEKYREISDAISQQLDRGTTLIQAETGYRHYPSQVVLTIIANRELSRLNDLVLTIDPKAFMIINRVNQVKGRGFTMGKIYKD